jgi:hypothetical protein
VLGIGEGESAVDLQGGAGGVAGVGLDEGVVDAGFDPQEAGGRRVIFVSGDHAGAKSAVASLFEDAGFAAIDLGNLATGGAMQQIHHPLAGLNLIRL